MLLVVRADTPPYKATVGLVFARIRRKFQHCPRRRGRWPLNGGSVKEDLVQKSPLEAAIEPNILWNGLLLFSGFEKSRAAGRLGLL